MRGPTGEAFDEVLVMQESAVAAGVPWSGPPEVGRTDVAVAGRRISAVVWGAGDDAEVVLLHGGQQNAHTWDLVALSLDRPVVAVDLAGHGHSDPVAGSFDPRHHAEDLAVALPRLAPKARLVAGMSLGGLSGIRLAALHPELVGGLVVIDVTPGVVHGRRHNEEMYRLTQVESFDSFEAMVDEVAKANPARSKDALRRGLLFNTKERDDGRWVWRWQWGSSGGDGDGSNVGPYVSLWDDLSRLRCPVTLVRGERSLVVTEVDEAEFLRRRPETEVVVIAGAGHSVQGSRPVELAALLADRLDRAAP
ncbi:MAG TPA: alpha/beta hydrolase [Acidimicrobiales bacterium]|nr:alpha/beta hydrolase [Acidimicrobiales bacterium]